MIIGIEATGDILGTIGVFLSGAGSILTALGAIHYERKRGEQICNQRFDAFKEGIHLGDERKEKDEP